MLDLACFRGNTDCVETLLIQGAKILVHDNITRRTPLHAAGECGAGLCKTEEKIIWL